MSTLEGAAMCMCISQISVKDASVNTAAQFKSILNFVFSALLSIIYILPFVLMTVYCTYKLLSFIEDIIKLVETEPWDEICVILIGNLCVFRISHIVRF